jgi:hypothetical protein
MARRDTLMGLVRLRTKEISQQDVSDAMLYDLFNLVQGNIMREKRCNEKTFTITLVADQESYDYASEECYFIKNIYPSWEGDIKLVSNQEWSEVKDATNEHPCYATIFSRKLYLAPAPATGTTDTIELWGYQTAVLVPMDATHDPEIPSYLDEVLLCAQLDPKKYFEHYQVALRQSMSADIKSTLPKVVTSRYL